MGRLVNKAGKPIKTSVENTNTVRFGHGLGDCTYFAFLAQLYLKRGIPVTVDCPADKRWLFESCGLRFSNLSSQHHPWYCPRHVEANYFDDWQGNKITESILRPEPLPPLGEPAEVWKELLDVRLDVRYLISEKIWDEVAAWVGQMNGPVILTHTRGRTCPGSKNIDQYEAEMFRTLVDSGATVVHLDWDRSSPDYQHSSIVDACVKGMSLEKLVALIYQADAMIGIDSGPCHLARLNYDLPTLQVWTRHTPASYVLPRPNLVGITDQQNPCRSWTPYKQHAFNLLEISKLSGYAIAETCLEMLRPRVFTDHIGHDLLLSNLLVRMQTSSVPYRNSHKALANFISLLPDQSQVVEVGGFAENGICSAYVLGLLLENTKGKLHTFKPAVTPFKCIEFHEGKAVDWLANHEGTIDGLLIGKTSPVEALAVFNNAESKLSPNTVVMVDDCPFSCRNGNSGIHGTGRLLVPHLINKGWQVLEAGSGYVFRRASE